MNDGDPAFYWMDLDHTNVADLSRSMAETLSPLGTESTALYGIVSEEDGGIIGYAIGLDHANQITDALKLAVKVVSVSEGSQHT